MSLCGKDISKNVVSNCSTQQNAGIEQIVYVMNRADVVPVFDQTQPNKMTGLSLVSGAKCYKLIGQKQNLVCGFDRVVSETRGDMFIHYLSFQAYEFDSESAFNLNDMDDLCIVVERKAKDVLDGTFMCYGFGTGLSYTSDTYRSNSEDGVRMLEMQTQASQPEKEPYYTLVKTDYSTTKSLLEGLCA